MTLSSIFRKGDSMKLFYKKDDTIGVLDTNIKGKITKTCKTHYHVSNMTDGNVSYNDIKIYIKELTIPKPS